MRRLAWPLMAVLALSVVGDYHIAKKRADDAFDLALVDAAFDLAGHVHVDHQTGELKAELDAQAEHDLRTVQYDELYFSIVDDRGTVLVGDQDLPRAAVQSAQPQVYDAQYRGAQVRAVQYALSDGARHATVVVAETTKKRDIAGRETVVAMILPNLAQFLGVLLLIYFAVRSSFRSLDALRAQIGKRSPDDLHPLDTAGVPLEVRSIVESLNHLFTLLNKAQAEQKRFIADAAHQLRTPLAALQTQIDLLVPGEIPPRDRLQRIEAAVVRMTRVVRQLLTLARMDASDAALKFEAVDLKAIAEESASIFLDYAVSKGIDLGFELAPAPINGVAELLTQALGNLLENALQHTPQGGRITVRCGVDGGEAYIEVEDSGPGIAPSERPRVVDRFYRTAQSQGSGCGLGLSIVQEIATMHRAHLYLAEGLQDSGLRAGLRFSCGCD